MNFRDVINVIKENFGEPLDIIKVSEMVYHITYSTKELKLEIFQSTPEPIDPWWEPGKSWNTVAPQHKLYRSLEVHEWAIDSGLDVPTIRRIDIRGDTYYKFTDWIKGHTVMKVLKKCPWKIPEVCNKLGTYVSLMFAAESITPCDPHFANFVWTENESVMYVDMKKLLYCREHVHILQMAKICLKSTRGDREMALNFLKGYNEWNDATLILNFLANYNWMMGIRGIDPIRPEEL